MRAGAHPIAPLQKFNSYVPFRVRYSCLRSERTLSLRSTQNLTPDLIVWNVPYHLSPNLLTSCKLEYDQSLNYSEILHLFIILVETCYMIKLSSTLYNGFSLHLVQVIPFTISRIPGKRVLISHEQDTTLKEPKKRPDRDSLVYTRTSEGSENVLSSIIICLKSCL